jgi:hypothetical protein
VNGGRGNLSPTVRETLENTPEGSEEGKLTPTGVGVLRLGWVRYILLSIKLLP